MATQKRPRKSQLARSTSFYFWRPVAKLIAQIQWLCIWGFVIMIFMNR